MKCLISLLDGITSREMPVGLRLSFSPSELELKNDKELINLARSHNPFILEYASEEVRNNRELIKELVGDWWDIETYVPEDGSNNFKSDYQFVFSNPIIVAGDSVRQDDEFCQSLGFKKFDRKAALETIRANSSYDAIAQLSPKCWFDKEIVLEAIRLHVDFLAFAARQLKEDREIALEAIRRWKCDAFDYLGEPYLSDKDFMIIAIRMDEDCFHRASSECRCDLDVIKARLENYTGVEFWEEFESLDIDLDAYERGSAILPRDLNILVDEFGDPLS